MSTKGQSISINTIIIAAIALAVLVVLFAIFTGRIGGFSKGVGETASCANSCKALGKTGDLIPSTSKLDCETNGRGTYVPGNYDDAKSPNVCCCREPI